MKVVRDSAEELVIQSSGRSARIVATIFLLVGLGLCLPLAASYTSQWTSSRHDPHQPRPWILLALGLFIATPGVVMLFRVQDVDYHFDIKQGQLIARCRLGQTVIPFSIISNAEIAVSSGNDEPDTYGLRLILRERAADVADAARIITRGGDLKLLLRKVPASIDMTPLQSSGEKTRIEYTALADRINQILPTRSDPQ